MTISTGHLEDAIARIRENHRRTVDKAEPAVGIMSDHVYCRACDQSWPCPAIQAVDAHRAKQIAAMKAVR